MDAHWLALAERLCRRTFPPANVRLPSARSLRDIAYHEAAHVVMLELTGRPCLGATIDSAVAGNGWLGAAWSKDNHTCRPPDLAPLSAPMFIEERARLCAWAATSFAGRQAEYLRVGLDPGGWLDESAYDDEQARFYLSLAFGITHSSAPYAGCQQLARRMLIAHWRSVRAIAMLLLVRRTIDRARIVRAINVHRELDAPAEGAHLMERAAAAAKTTAARAQYFSPLPVHAGEMRPGENRVTAPTGRRKRPPINAGTCGPTTRRAQHDHHHTIAMGEAPQ